MVGNNHLAFALSINGRLADAQGLAAYTNLAHRLQYAVGYQQSPFYFGEGTQFLDNGDGTLTQQDVIARYLDREAFAIGIYPLNRFTRFELGLTLADLERSFLVFSQVVDQFGYPLNNASSRSGGSSKYYVEPSLSYVSDNTLFGYTGPIYGRRYRFGVTPAIGQFQWLGFSATIGGTTRFSSAISTIATRLTANLSYGRDADSLQKYLGYSDLIRGYDDQSFAITNANCPADVSATLSDATACSAARSCSETSSCDSRSIRGGLRARSRSRRSKARSSTMRARRGSTVRRWSSSATRRTIPRTCARCSRATALDCG